MVFRFMKLQNGLLNPLFQLFNYQSPIISSKMSIANTFFNAKLLNSSIKQTEGHIFPYGLHI